jgi:hypothetical protein
VLRQPVATARLAHANFRWRGGAAGTDRPLDRAFVSVQRVAGGRWRPAGTDLGLRILWRVDDDKPKFDGIPSFRRGEAGTYTAEWEPAVSAPLGRYRFVVTGNRYRIASRPFRLRPAHNLVAAIDRSPTTATVQLVYPPPVPESSLTTPPAGVGSGRVTLRIDGRRVSLHIEHGSATVRALASARVTVVAARDHFGNTSRK